MVKEPIHCLHSIKMHACFSSLWGSPVTAHWVFVECHDCVETQTSKAPILWSYCYWGSQAGHLVFNPVPDANTLFSCCKNHGDPIKVLHSIISWCCLVVSSCSQKTSLFLSFSNPWPGKVWSSRELQEKPWTLKLKAVQRSVKESHPTSTPLCLEDATSFCLLDLLCECYLPVRHLASLVNMLSQYHRAYVQTTPMKCYVVVPMFFSLLLLIPRRVHTHSRESWERPCPHSYLLITGPSYDWLTIVPPRPDLHT